MKGLKSILAMVMTLCMLSMTLTACGGQTEESSDGGTVSDEDSVSSEENASDEGNVSDGKMKVGIAIPTSQEEIWMLHAENLQKCAEDMGVEVIVQFANGDTDKQFSQIENMLTEGIDVLILAACDPGSTGKIVTKASEEGVKIIGYDRVWSGDPYDLYMTFDNVEVGRRMAEYAIEKAPAGNYTLLGGDVVNQPSTNEIHQGWMEVLQEHVDSGDITIVSDQNCKNWSSDEGLNHAENALTANNNEMAAILCANDGIAGGAIQALESAGLAGTTIVTGQDSEVAAAQRILAGKQTITLYKASYDLAKATVDAALQLVNGEEAATDGDYEGIPMISLPPIVVDKDNLDEILIDSGYMSKEEVYNE